MHVDLSGPFWKTTLRLLESIGTPRSLSVAVMLRNGLWEDALSLRCDPMHYIDAESFARDNLATELLRKLELDHVRDKDRLATECFERLEATERLCCETNVRMLRFIQGPLDPNDARLLPIIDKIRKNIRWLVGPVPTDLEGCGFGPGATLTNEARLSTIPDKLESVPTGTPSALYLYDLLYGDCAWERSQRPNQRARRTVRGSRFFTVPKTALAYRGAALSPNVNGFLQKGVGVYLRRRLERAGIRIRGAELVNGLFEVNNRLSTDTHATMAREGSLLDSFATIDLSDASNTIARRTIELLWPREWFQLMSDLRESLIQRPDGRYQFLEMFSAMGNGFTFELETITFWAIASACSGGKVSVFGDDIIVRTEDAPTVLAALKFFGFKVNTRKTFLAGPFRESCGSDFFNGVPVRAHYVKKLPTSPEEWIALANGLRRFARAIPTDNRWEYIRSTWWTILNNIPVHIRRLRGPEDLGDIVLHDDAAEGRVRDGITYWRCYAPVQTPVSLAHWPARVVYAAALYGTPSEGPLPRGSSVSGYRIKWVARS